MRIVKPYGRSHVERLPSGEAKRVLRLRSPNDADPQDIEEFARSHDELVIAQWISTIDKVATKPAGENSPTNEQRGFRERLGSAAWVLLEAKGLLSGLTGAKREHLARLWRAKVAPYGKAGYSPARNQRGRAVPSAKGRWYDRFTGGVAIDAVDAAAVAEKIYEHLHVAECRIAAGVPSREPGRIAARARSIAVNVPRSGSPAYAGGNGAGWGAGDLDAYSGAGNVALEIRQAALRRERGEDRAGTRRVTNNVAGAALFKHYARLFKGDEGNAMSIRHARERTPELFNLHMAVRDCYSRILKHHKKDQKIHGDRRREVSMLLPDTMERLFALVDAKGANRDLNALVRLGKVIHYTASGAADSVADVVTNWPADVSDSAFWTSDGQAAIKRNEAFVRVWRHVLALANRTLTDWADPGGNLDSDVLGNTSVETATGALFDQDSYGRKLDLLFGSRADTFKRTGDDGFQKGVLRLALKGIAELRHNSFHFKGLGKFAGALTPANVPADANVLAAVGKLWKADVCERTQQLLKTLRGVHIEYFLDQTQSHTLLTALSDVDVASIPLPRFSRMLRRAENAWAKGEDDLGLPAAANRTDLENPALLCQYTALKLVYDRVFRSWLEKRDVLALNRFIDRAVNRATGAARDLNTKNDDERRGLIIARAASLGRLADGDTVQTFFFNLSAATASEMRVQRGYESDGERAREQAEYIEDLKCDMVALAFRTYLTEAAFDFLLGPARDIPKPARPRHVLDENLPEVDTNAEHWQTILYFLIHLVPVEEIGKLLHQMRKWELLARDAEATTTGKAREIQGVLELYLDMHDAKFAGSAALIGTEAFEGLFASEAAFNRVFPEQPGADDARRIPKRGLREIMRFGHRRVLQPVFWQHRISEAEVGQFLAMEQLRDGTSEIARRQDRREGLHETWTRKRREFSGDELREYVEVLRDIVRHRHQAAQVTLTDHVRLHRLLMAVLGRLVDYSGLWERDLYFVTLALIHAIGRNPQAVFTERGLKRLGEGRIVDAVRELEHTADARTVRDRLRGYFGTVYEKRNRLVDMRNAFAHFNMLRPPRGAAGVAIDLTGCVNDARELMAYDRKLKNAVTQSVKELLHREGLSLEWTMDAAPAHRLGAATLATRQADHLGGKILFEAQQRGESGSWSASYPLRENLHGDSFVAMVATLFRQGTAQSRPSVVDIHLDRIDWQRTKA